MKMAGLALLLLAPTALVMLAACAGEEDLAKPTSTSPTTASISATEEPAGPTATPWAWFRTFGGNRGDLSTCVEGAGGLSVSDSDVQLVRRGLNSITSNLGEGGYLSYIAEARTPKGCPPPPFPLGTAISRYDAARLMHRVRVPSEHFVFVYFLPEDVYEATFGDEPYFEVGVEMCCMTGNNASVTWSVYTTRSIAEGKLGEALMHAMAFPDYRAPGDVRPTPRPS